MVPEHTTGSPVAPPPPLAPAPYRAWSRHGNPYVVADGQVTRDD